MKDIAPAIWFYALTIGLMLSLRGPLGPRPGRHRIRFNRAGGPLAPLVRCITYDAAPLDRRCMTALTEALAVGVPQDTAVHPVFAAAFVRRWWHVGPLAPTPHAVMLMPDLQLKLLEALLAPPTEVHHG